MGKNYKKQLILFGETIISTMICASGVALFVEAGLGSDTIDVLIDGMHKSLDITLGQADQLFSIGFLVLALLLNCRYIGWPSILYTLMIGFAIDGVNMFLMPMELSNMPFLIRFAAIVLAQLCFALSYAIFQSVERGMNTVDAVIYFFTERFSVSYVKTRTMLDILFLAGGFFLGGAIGIGTVLSTCTTGITTRALFQIVEKMKKRSAVYTSLFYKEEVLK